MKTMCLGVLLLVLIAVTAIPANAQQEKKGKFTILGSGGIPVGDFSDINKPGFGGLVQITGSPEAAPELSIGGTTGLIWFSGKALNFFGVDVTAPDVTIIPILATVQYTFSTEGATKPYLQTGLGICHLRAGEVTASFAGTTTTVGASTTTRFGLAPGGGLLIQIAPNKSWFNVQAAYHIISTSGGSTTFLNILAGVSTAFGQ